MYVQITKEQFESFLPSGHKEIKVAGCLEFVYQFSTKNPSVFVRIYSTIDHRTMVSRPKGSDAIRVVFTDPYGNIIGKESKVLRVEGKTTIGERIRNRVEYFLNNAPEPPKDLDKRDPKYLEKILTHPRIAANNFGQNLLSAVRQRGKLSDKQLAYVIGEAHPKGYQTFEQQILSKDPDYFLEDKVKAETLSLPETFYEVAELGELDIGEEVSLIPTSEYKGWEYPFSEFNPVQSEVMKYRTEDCNLVISANTSAGKTVCAELIMDDIIEKGLKVIYMSPLKSLSNEKANDWKKRFPNNKVIMLTGDTLFNQNIRKRMMEEAAESDIIIMTSELLDSVTRHHRTDKYWWLSEVGLVVVDEAHTVTMESRGHVIECALMRLASINPLTNILFLSATMSNTQQMAEWVELLNKKETNLVYSTWRPVELNVNWVSFTPKGTYAATENLKIETTVSIINQKPFEKFLIFVHAKGTGRKILKVLEANGITAKFHNADLPVDERREIETSFLQKTGGLRVMVSTSSTAYGVNLPARNVIIVGTTRGLSDVDELDIIQEMGRAGRIGYDDKGFVYIICTDHELELWKNKIANPRPVTSVLNDIRVLAFHTVSEIYNDNIKSPEDFLVWYKKSLASLQGEVVEKEDAINLMEELERIEAITFNGRTPEVTTLGKVSAWLYYDPYSIYDWLNNFRRLDIDKSKYTDLELSWAMGNISSVDMGYIPKEAKEEATDYEFLIHKYGLKANTRAVQCLAYFRQLTGMADEKEPPVITAVRRNIVFDIDRIVQAVKYIDKYYGHFKLEDMWELLPLRIKYGVSEELIDLVRIKGIGAKRARKLYDRGVHSIKDLLTDKGYLAMRQVFKPHTAAKIIQEARSLVQQ